MCNWLTVTKISFCTLNIAFINLVTSKNASNDYYRYIYITCWKSNLDPSLLAAALTDN